MPQTKESPLNENDTIDALCNLKMLINCEVDSLLLKFAKKHCNSDIDLTKFRAQADKCQKAHNKMYEEMLNMMKKD